MNETTTAAWGLFLYAHKEIKCQDIEYNVTNQTTQNEGRHKQHREYVYDIMQISEVSKKWFWFWNSETIIYYIVQVIHISKVRFFCNN